jgi:dTDP-4-dehydrorhamnose 3,5-epimerase-like enzyme
MTHLPDVPTIVPGGISVDDRGEVAFVNEFDFAGIKRFYTVTNHQQGFVRAWHAHRKESKYVTVTSGAALIGAVRVDDWERPAVDAKVHRFVLSAHKPSILIIPLGHANGFMSLTADAKLMFFSTSTLEESLGDDVRYPARHWDIWSVEER